MFYGSLGLRAANAQVYVEHPAGWVQTPKQLYTDSSGRFGLLLDRNNSNTQTSTIRVYTESGHCVSLEVQLTNGNLPGKQPTPPPQTSCRVGDVMTAVAELGNNDKSTTTAIATHPQIASLQQLTKRVEKGTTFYDFRIQCHAKGMATFLLGSSKYAAISFTIQVP